MKIRILTTCFLLVGASSLLHGQVTSPNANAAPVVSTFGNADAATLQYSAESGPINEFLLSTGYQFSYDDNVLGATGNLKQGDQVHDLNAQVQLLHAGPRWNTSIEYIPFYEFYGHFTQYNRLDQHMAADVTATLSPRWAVRMRDSFDDLTNPYGPGGIGGNGLGSPSSLNSTIFVPLASERGNSARADLVWNQRGRNSAFVFGGFENRDFTQIVPGGRSLINTQGPTGGADYSWRTTEHTSVGMLYLFERLDFGGALPVGSPKRLDIHGILPSFGWQPSPTVQITAFAGPEVANQTIQPVAPSTTPTTAQQIVWAGGGTISRQSSRTSWFVIPQRIVADGGGYFSYVISTSINAAIRQELPFASKWDATVEFQAAKNEAFSAETTNINLTGQSATFQLQHPLGERLMTNLNYDFTRQSSSQSNVTGVNFNRNRVSLGISYQWSASPQMRK